MGDVKPKGLEKGVSIQCPMLTATNYTVWAMRMKVVLRIHKVWEAVEKGVGEPEKNDIAIALIFQSIPESLILQVGEQDSPKDMWEAIKARHVGADRVKEARLQTLMAEFDRMKMKESDTIDNFAGKLSEIATKAAALGETIDEPKLVKKFLHSLPRSKYIHIIASLEQVLDLKTTGFEDIIGRLKAYEERIVDEDSNTETQGKLLFSNSDERSSSSSRGRGRGRGGRGSRGRGRGRGNSQDRSTNQQEKSDSKEKKDMAKIVCWRCDRHGHYATSCPEKKKTQEANKLETEEADAALYMLEIVFLNEEKVIPKNFESNEGEEGVWYLDNGASNHMTGNKEFFTELEDKRESEVWR